MELEQAVKVVAWISKKRKSGRKGFPYDVDGNPVIDKADAVSLKATFVHNKWCEPDTKLSGLAWDNNKEAFVFNAWSELLGFAGMADEATEEEAVDV